MRIGCSTIPLAPLSGEQALRTLKNLGFEVVDIAAVPTVFDHVRTRDATPDQPARFGELIAELGLEVNGIPTVVGVPDVWDDLPELRRRCTAAADVAAAVGAKCWIVDAGVYLPGEEREVTLKRFKRVLAMQYELAAERKLRLAIEAPHSGTLAEHYSGIADVLEIAEGIGADVGLDLDTRPVFTCGAPVEEIIERYGSRVAHVAVGDVGGQSEGHVPLGEGDVDLQLFIDLLRGVGFNGDLMLELEPGGASVESRIAFIDHDREYVSGLLSAFTEGSSRE